jgi:hypothetical protein
MFHFSYLQKCLGTASGAIYLLFAFLFPLFYGKQLCQNRNSGPTSPFDELKVKFVPCDLQNLCNFVRFNKKQENLLNSWTNGSVRIDIA